MLKGFRFFYLIILILLIFTTGDLFAQGGNSFPLPNLSVNIGNSNNGGNDMVLTLQILAVMTVLTLAPSILIMMTCFTRIVIVFHFLRQALGTATQPPNQIITGLALFLTFFIMQPVMNKANETGIQPYMKDEITQEKAVENIIQPFREFMLKNTREDDLALFVKLSGSTKPMDRSELTIWQIIPAYTISELKVAFQIGFMVFIPFLVLDMIIASTLMSLGMFLLPPQLISLPIKILLFILVDGWYLLVDSLVKSIIN